MLILLISSNNPIHSEDMRSLVFCSWVNGAVASKTSIQRINLSAFGQRLVQLSFGIWLFLQHGGSWSPIFIHMCHGQKMNYIYIFIPIYSIICFYGFKMIGRKKYNRNANDLWILRPCHLPSDFSITSEAREGAETSAEPGRGTGRRSLTQCRGLRWGRHEQGGHRGWGQVEVLKHGAGLMMVIWPRKKW